MELTGKAKEQFEEWYLKTIPSLSDWRYKKNGRIEKCPSLLRFHKLPDSMKWGVYIDFFDSVGVYATLIPNWKKGIRTFHVGFHVEYGGVIDSLFLRPEKDSPFFSKYDTRQEARTAAIEKANEIVNNK